MEIKEVTKEAVIEFLTVSRKDMTPAVKKTEHSVHTLLNILDMRAYNKGGDEFEWVVNGLYRETITELLIEKLKKL